MCFQWIRRQRTSGLEWVFLPVVYGSKVLTSNLRRLLAGLTWILQHELSEQWESRAE